MKDLVYLVASTIILAPVFVSMMCDNCVIALGGMIYGMFLYRLASRPRVRKFILRVYRAQLRLFSGHLVCEL